MGKYIKIFSTQSAYNEAQASFDLPNVSLITDGMTVEFDPYVVPSLRVVDLGLPSGTKWAKCNIGANTETGYGLYFSWGSTTGYADASTKNFAWEDYELGNGGDKAADMTKYNSSDGKTVLETVDDAAYQYTNGIFRTPTKEEFDELLNAEYVTNTWVTDYNGSGVNGRLFTSVSNGNTLFIPASGFCMNGGIRSRGSIERVWTSSVSSFDLRDAWFLYHDSANIKMDGYGYRRTGQNIRGVLNAH